MTCWDKLAKMILLPGGRPPAFRAAACYKLLHTLFRS